MGVQLIGEALKALSKIVSSSDVEILRPTKRTFADSSSLRFRESLDRESEIVYIKQFKECDQRVYRSNVSIMYLVIDDPLHGVKIYDQCGLVTGRELDDWRSEKRV